MEANGSQVDDCSLHGIHECDDSTTACLLDQCLSDHGVLTFIALVIPVLGRVVATCVNKTALCAGATDESPHTTRLLTRVRSVQATGFTCDDCFHGGGGTGSNVVNRARARMMSGNNNAPPRATTNFLGARIRPATSWSRAVDKTYGSDCEDSHWRAVSAAAWRMLLFHSQPVVFFYLFNHYTTVIDDLDLRFWVRGVLTRELMYAISLAACTCANPAFLLVDIAKSVKARPPEPHSEFRRQAMDEMGLQHMNSWLLALFGVPLNDGYVFRFHYGSGWKFAVMFVLAPEKFVLMACICPLMTQTATNVATVTLLLFPLGVSFIYDAFGLMALVNAIEHMPMSLAFGFAVSGVFGIVGVVTVVVSALATCMILISPAMLCCVEWCSRSDGSRGRAQETQADVATRQRLHQPTGSE